MVIEEEKANAMKAAGGENSVMSKKNVM